MTEAVVQSKIIKYLESKGAYVVKVISANKKGAPDLLICYNGRFIGIEVKQPAKKKNVSELQVHNLKRIQEAGGLSCVAWSLAEIDDILSKL